MNCGLYSSDRHEWSTPQEFFDRLDAEFHFYLDAAASPENAKCDWYYTQEQDGLTMPWPVTTFCNPPYGRQIGKWIKKGYEEGQQGRTIVMLIPSRTDTRWWHDYVMKAAEIRFVKGRLYFSIGDERGRAPFPSAVVVFVKGDHKPRLTAMEAL